MGNIPNFPSIYEAARSRRLKEKTAMLEGILRYHDDIRRYVIFCANSADEGIQETCELHCGDCFQVKCNDNWIPTQIEYRRNQNDINHGWYLIDKLSRVKLERRRVKID